MRVLVGQISPIVGDIPGNLERCLEAVQAGRAAGCRVVVLPELALSGYPPRDLLERFELTEWCDAAAATLASATGSDGAGAGLIVVVGAPVRDSEGLRNAALVLAGGRVAAVVRKSLLPTYDVFDEARYFVPETDPRPVEIEGLRLGVTICEDLWNEPDLVPPRRYHVDPIDRMVGCDLLVNISASPFDVGKGSLRLELVRRQAAQADAPLVYCNMVGGNDELIFDGDSLVVRADGTLVGQGPRFTTALQVVELDGPAVQHQVSGFEEQAVDALTMGIADYAARCGFRSAVLGLSGGIDSALVAALAARALGPENLLCIGMPGPYSSEGSIRDARQLAGNLGCRFELIPIGGVFDALRTSLAPLFAGRAPDVTEENLQARARGTILMAASNKFGHLLLTTGNKSELAVGYCTLYGDMNGGLAAIADVFKTDVYRLCRWLNRDGELIPSSTLTKPPSAELAPDQKDEDSLPPYALLDDILRLYIEDGLRPEDIAARGFDAATVERVVRMIVASEYKRWQAPPALRISGRAFGMGRRIPLAKRWRGP